MTTTSPIAGLHAGAPAPGARFDDGLPRARASAMGVDASAVAAWLDDVEQAGLDLHAFMLHRHGHVIAEGWRWPYRADRLRNLHSVAKSFTACAIAFAIEEGRLRLEDRLGDFFAESPPAPHPAAAMTVADLLTMRTGHAGETSGAVWRRMSSSWIEAFFAIPVETPPGSNFVYTSAASYMLSALVSRVTGETTHEYLRPRLFAPLGISGETWDIGTDGINPGGNGLWAHTADLLKLGILHVQGGVWEGRRVLPEAWVAEATRAQEASNRYGYHWWVHDGGSYSAIGKFVQLVRVFPEAGVTLAVTGAIKGSKRLMPLIEWHLPAAFRDAPFDGAAADAALDAALARWQSPEAASPWQRAFEDTQAERPGVPAVGEWRFVLDPNEGDASELRLLFAEGRCECRLVDREGEHVVTAGLGRWIESTTDMPGADLHHGYRFQDSPVVARAGWVDEATLRMVWLYPETAFRDLVECEFDGERVTLRRSVNINSGALALKDLSGRRAAS
ncbi:serine hydrolase domain-containing protein [Burkholderia gladioli]|uniref:serine hydrolase domain-containing protein n=1 Tax=Burkholderia gladioli TaxID=28095 RepID=UPI001641410C|nr:serine hydrolase [Burkholderia gladioli]